MLAENISTLRKARGMSQEALADRVHVVRQTVSKWEKGLSVPDADALADLAEVFGVSVGELLGGDVQPDPDRDLVAEQLAIMNEQLAEQNRSYRKTRKTVLVILAIIVLIPLSMPFLTRCAQNANDNASVTVPTASLVIQRNDQTYGYTIGFDENHRMVWQSGDPWVVEIAESFGTDDAEEILDRLVVELRHMGATVLPGE